MRTLRDQHTEMATIAWAKMWEALKRYHFFPHCQATPQGPVWQHVPPGGVRNPPIHHLPVHALANTAHMSRKAGCSVHLCEAPGAFVAATNQYVRTELGYLDWQWRAMTLSPYHVGNDAAAMVEDDALLVQTKPNWHFGRDKSGAPPPARLGPHAWRRRDARVPRRRRHPQAGQHRVPVGGLPGVV